MARGLRRWVVLAALFAGGAQAAWIPTWPAATTETLRFGATVGDAAAPGSVGSRPSRAGSVLLS